MAHIIDIMATVNGQLNLISKWFENKSGSLLKSLPSIPNFVEVCIDRLVDLNPDVKIENDQDCEIYKVMLADTGDNYNPVYLVIVTNSKKVLIDKVPIYVNRGSETGPGVGYVVEVPEAMFLSNTDITDCATMLNDLYFGLLAYDSNMKYAPELDLIKFSKAEKLKIPTYDLEMIYVALGCAYINLRSWFGGNYGNTAIDASYILAPFDDKEIPDNLKSGIIETLNKHCIKIGTLRDSIGDGSLIMDALYE